MLITTKIEKETHMAYIMVAYSLLFNDDNIANTFDEIIRNKESDLWKLAIEK